MKRPTTALTFKAKSARRLLVALLALATTATVQWPAIGLAQDGMRPVPRFSGTSIRDQRNDFQKSAASQSLQWRTSGEVAPVAATSQVVVPASHSESLAPTTTAAAPQPRGIVAPVRQARYQNDGSLPGDSGGLKLPPGLQMPAPPTMTPPTVPQPAPGAAKPLPDFFSDPFGDEAAGPAPSLGMPEPMPQSPTKPAEPNGLRDLEPLEPPETDPLPAPKPTKPSETAPNPFDRTRSDDERKADERDRQQLEDIDIPRREGDRAAPSKLRELEDDAKLKKTSEFSCDDFRKSIAAATIQTLSLDISPPFRPDVIEINEYRKLKDKFDNGQEARDWQSVDGRKLGRGRLRDLAYEKIVIETEFGTMEQIPINRISEADLAYLSKNWGLPQECLIEQAAYQERSWDHAKVTWKAPNLCHKPLYFEEVNLERYGHTGGPFLQPVISSAHFFANIAVLPYKMGVHAPNECQYALGYYRPGNCAPWIVPPVPLSLRGGLYQAAAMTGTFLLIP